MIPDHTFISPPSLLISHFSLLPSKFTNDQINWKTLTAANFSVEGGEADWLSLYPVKTLPMKDSDDEQQYAPVGNFSPRQAAKFFYDGLYLIEEGEKNPRTLMNQIPEMAHKLWKRKQWQKQFSESCRRVCCRLVKGLGFSANCLAEDVFVICVLETTFGLGWRRIESHLEDLPWCQLDRDFSKIKRLETSAEVQALWLGVEAVVSAQSANKKKNKDATVSNPNEITDPKNWFRGYAADKDHLLDHHLDVDIKLVEQIQMVDKLVDMMPENYEDMVLEATKSPCAVFITESSSPFRVKHVNEAWVSACGYQPEEVIGKDLSLIQGPETDIKALEQLETKAEAGKDHRIELVNYSKDGKAFNNHLRIKHLASRMQSSGYMLGVLHRTERS